MLQLKKVIHAFEKLLEQTEQGCQFLIQNHIVDNANFSFGVLLIPQGSSYIF